jgi:hypothetical protein
MSVQAPVYTLAPPACGKPCNHYLQLDQCRLKLILAMSTYGYHYSAWGPQTPGALTPLGGLLGVLPIAKAGRHTLNMCPINLLLAETRASVALSWQGPALWPVSITVRMEEKCGTLSLTSLLGELCWHTCKIAAATSRANTPMHMHTHRQYAETWSKTLWHFFVFSIPKFQLVHELVPSRHTRSLFIAFGITLLPLNAFLCCHCVLPCNQILPLAD